MAKTPNALWVKGYCSLSVGYPYEGPEGKPRDLGKIQFVE